MYLRLGGVKGESHHVGPVSRVESQRQTRAALLDAALREFSEHGFLAAALERIADRAGYTRGAIYKNFSDKYDLFYAVLTHWITQHTDRLSRDLAAAPDGPPQLDVLQAWFDTYLVPQSLTVAYNEFCAAAASRPQARELLAQHQHTIRTQIAAMIDDYCERGQVAIPIPSDHFAALVAALATGLANQRSLEPAAVPRELYADALIYLWTGMLAASSAN
jgi:AcrR family transcriptional regulator